jgi:hypothetical protein
MTVRRRVSAYYAAWLLMRLVRWTGYRSTGTWAIIVVSSVPSKSGGDRLTPAEPTLPVWLILVTVTSPRETCPCQQT